MFAHAVPSPSTISTSTTPTSTPPSRPSRLRGLSYLRNYTQHHLSLNSPHSTGNSLTRSTSTPFSGENLPSALTSPLSPPADWLSSYNGPTDTPSPTTKLHSTSIESPIPSPAAGSNPGGISRIMARHRGGNSQNTRRGQSVPAAPYSPETRNHASLPRSTSSNTAGTSNATVVPLDSSSGLAGLPQDQMPTIKFIPHQDPRASKPSLTFSTTSRTLPHEDCVIRVGRYSERDGNPNPPANVPSSAPVGFKSKVVSRRHCEFWCSQGQWYIKDVRSSSGTFLNHIRLSQPSVESRPFPVNDGDIVQLGIDFRGGEEMIFRCVKIRVECNRSWQKSLNNFNMTTHKRLRALGKSDTKTSSDTASTHSSECSICLMPVAPCQSLFVAPCSHVWHYKCIRPILNDHKTWPQFLCPNCRAVADLEADIEDVSNFAEWEDLEEAGSPPESIGMANPMDDISSERERSMDDDLDEALAASTLHLSVADLAAISEASPPTGTNYLSEETTNSFTQSTTRPRFGVIGEHPVIAPSHIEDDDFSNSSTPHWSQDTDLETQQEQVTPRASMLLSGLTHTSSEAMIAEGPLTPRNNIGPFVFDGSAGRTSGRRIASSLTETTDDSPPAHRMA